MKKKRCRNRSKAISKRSGLTVLVAGLIRQIETSEQTLYQWKKKYKALEVDQVRHVVLIDKVASARAHLEQVRTHNGHRGIEAVAGLPSYGHNDVS